MILDEAGSGPSSKLQALLNRTASVGEHLCETLTCLAEKAVLHGLDIAVSGIHFDALHSMHRKKYCIWRNIFSSFDQSGEVFKRIQVNPTQTDSRAGNSDHCTPVFLARIVQRNKHDRAARKHFR